MKRYAIIVAGGTGSRMQADLPKQFLMLKGKPVLMHTLEKFNSPEINIILVLNVDQHDYWNKLCKDQQFDVQHILARGGNTRFESVKNGLKLIEKDSVVSVHDAARPLVSKELIEKSFIQAEEKGSAVTYVILRDSIRKISGDKSYSLKREEHVLIQTPQVFKSEILRNAYKKDFRNEFTDDASVVEFSGKEIDLIEGNHENIKITFPEDLLMAEAILNKKS